MISVLIPSRGRPEELNEAVRSLHRSANDPQNIRILVRIDNEDEKRREYYQSSSIMTFLTGSEYEGYCSMDKFWNELAERATGSWLFCFNDDARMITPSWDRIVESYDPAGMTCLVPEDNSTTNGWPAFPIFPRAMFEKLGHITRFPGLDTWVKYVWEAAKLPVERVPIKIHHRRAELEQLEEETAEASKVASRHLCLDFDVHRRDYWRALIEEDARKLCG